MTEEQLKDTNLGTINTGMLNTGTLSTTTLSTGTTVDGDRTPRTTTIRSTGITTRTTVRIAARPIGNQPLDPREPPDPVDPPPRPPRPPAVDNDAASLFRRVAAAQLARFIPDRAIKPPLPMLDGTLADAFAAVLTSTSPTLTFAVRTQAVFTLPDTPVNSGIVPGPVRLSPAFPQPMAEPLVGIAQEAVLPELDLIPPNTVVPLETNSRFVQAFMVGLNTEMGRELMWRDYPADLSATYFNRFWTTRPRHRAFPTSIQSVYGAIAHLAKMQSTRTS